LAFQMNKKMKKTSIELDEEKFRSNLLKPLDSVVKRVDLDEENSWTAQQSQSPNRSLLTRPFVSTERDQKVFSKLTINLTKRGVKKPSNQYRSKSKYQSKYRDKNIRYIR